MSRPEQTDSGQSDRPQELTLWRSLRSTAPGFIKRSFSAKFLFSFLFVVLLISAIGATTFVHIQDTIEDDASEQLRSTARLRADMVGQWVLAMQSQTRMISASDRLPTGTRSDVSLLLRRSKAQASLNVIALHYVDTTNGTIRASTESDVEGKQLSSADTPWEPMVTDLADSTTAPSAVSVSPDAYVRENQSVVAFVTLTDDRSGAIVLVGSLQRHLLSTESAVATTVVNEDGQALFTASSSDVDYGNATGFAASKRTRTVQLTETEDHLRAFSTVEGAPWVTVTSAPKDDVYEVADAVGSNVTRIVVSSVLSLSLIGFVLGRQTVVPLVRLRRRTEEMQSGDLDVDLTTERVDEIGRLFRGFAQMRDALRKQIRDAHEARRQAEASRREMVRQNERLDQFASTLSHDLRNPLAVARGHVELLRASLQDGEPTPETLSTHVEKMDAAHDRIDSIINDVLMLTREGEHVEETTAVELLDVATDAWENVDSRDATLSIDESHVIEADRNRLLRLFENVFRNAIDHVGDDVEVTLGLLEDGFYLADDGPGIPDDEVDDVFEYGHTTSSEGTGLGLSIVKTIAEAHGWSVHVDTEYDGGACFTFSDVFEDEPLDFEDTQFAWGETASQFEWGSSSAGFEWASPADELEAAESAAADDEQDTPESAAADDDAAADRREQPGDFDWGLERDG
ncbi:sensor histidine kinase [Haloarculaceae archaeon H-GB2-1]|nr:sensor histidine kinase [Haloarculaceae archaeon H-GB1-1]MEA5407340.1 sensor histidine kinase [Haloarculaceae archaeon H-GB2-1]